MKLARIASAAVLLSLFAVAGFAGERVEGNGWTKESAARSAERRACQLARDKGTCEISRANLSRCKREGDGTWTCQATADNHGASCGTKYDCSRNF